MSPLVAIFWAASMVFLSVALILAVRTSRRAVKWHEQRTAEAVDRVVDRLITALADDDDTESGE